MPSLNFNFRGISFSFTPSYLQAGAIIFLLFLLVLSLAQVRRYFVHWSFKGALFGIFFGFLLALILEGFLLIGGKTVVIEFLGWEKAPKPILVALEAGRAKLVQVLGVTTEIPRAETLINFFQSLTPQEASKAKKIICQ